jgi:hypothetical protein
LQIRASPVRGEYKAKIRENLSKKEAARRYNIPVSGR